MCVIAVRGFFFLKKNAIFKSNCSFGLWGSNESLRLVIFDVIVVPHTAG